jgi:hypothetical protein
MEIEVVGGQHKKIPGFPGKDFPWDQGKFLVPFEKYRQECRLHIRARLALFAVHFLRRRRFMTGSAARRQAQAIQRLSAYQRRSLYSHGGMGSGSDHSPVFADRAAF